MEILTRAELIARVGGPGAYRRALRDATWKRVVRGAYLQGDVDVTLAVRAAAVSRVLPAHAVLADRCLLWVLGVDVLPPGPPSVECVVPRTAVIPRRTGLKVREAHLPKGDVGVLDTSRVRALTAPRATVDLLRLSAPVEALVVADAVLRAGLCTRDELRAELPRHVRLRGVVQARRTVERADARAESPPESRLRHWLHEAGFPVVPQVEVFDGTRWLARVDLALPELKIAIEYDGREVHDRDDVFVRDRRRQNALVAAGWLVLRFSAADLRGGGAAVGAAVARAVEAQTRRTA